MAEHSTAAEDAMHSKLSLSNDMVEQLLESTPQRSENDSSSSSSSGDLTRSIHDKIKSAFSKITPYFISSDVIIQFWTPITIRGRSLLSTVGQPFTLSQPNERFHKYRLRSVEYAYNIDVNVNYKQQLDINEQVKPPAMIINGAPAATAFLNRFPLFVHIDEGSPLTCYALECGYKTSYMLPVCWPSQNSSSCIGVLEYSVASPWGSIFRIPKVVNEALQEVGLSICQVQQRIPYEIISGLKPAKAEIEDVLKILCKSYDIALAQVWIPFHDRNHVSFSSCLEGTRKKQILSLKLTGYLAGRNSELEYDYYYALYDMFPLEMGEDFVDKTLEDYKPRFCNDVSKLSGDPLVKQVFERYYFTVSRLAICLNSIHTGAFCYAFEFIWEDDPHSDDVEFVEELLLKLKELLPSFKLASGAELGDEIDIINVGGSTATETNFLKIFQGKRSENDSASSGDLTSSIHDKIISAFSKITTPDIGFRGILQLWTPITIDGRRLLSTALQPFTLGKHNDEGCHKYRQRSVEYAYNIHVNVNYNINEEVNPPARIINGAPAATAFLNRFPLFVDIDKGNPLTSYDLECGLKKSFMLPVCWPSKNSSCCIGVVECSIPSPWSPPLVIPKLVKKALQEVGLSIFQVQQRIPYQMIRGLKPAKAEIEDVLKIVCESNDIVLAQVWIPFDVSSSSYLEGTRKKQMLSLKLTGYLPDTEDFTTHDEYYGFCDMFPLEKGEDFVDKTLEDYKPRFCNDFYKLSDTLVKKIFCVAGFGRLAICLNSIRTGNFCYAFEFIWCHGPDSDDVEFVEELLLKLKELLPIFKLASGAELGDELDVINVGDSTATEIKFMKIFQGKRLSPIPKVLEEGTRIPVPMVEDYIAPLEAKYKTTPIPLSREVIEQQFGNTETEAAENLKDGELLVFWSKDEEGSQNNSSSADLSTRRRVRDKIISALQKLKYHPGGLIIQFWEPVKIGNKRILSTYQPFAVCHPFSNDLRKYRLLSEKCEHDIDVNKQIGIHGTPATAFLNRFPEVVVQDTSVHKGSPLVRHALECTRMTSLMLPICCPPEISCLGVVECSLTRLWPRIDKMLKEINRVLKEEHLSVFRVQERIPYKNIDGLKPAKDEIEKALKIVCESHNIRLAQVWIPFTAENSVPYSFSLVDTQAKAMFAVQLTSYGTDYSNDGDGDGDDDDDDADLERYLRAYSYLYDFVPLKMGEELVLKTLQDHKSRFYKDTFQPNNSLLSKLQDSKEFRSSGLAICLRSTETRDFDYMFEFAWNHKSDIVIFMEALLLTLKRCLPNFKFACGAELGDELDVESAIKNFKVFQGKISSPMPELEALERGKNPMVEDCTVPSQAKREKGDELSNEDITQLFGITMEEAAKILKISLSTFKRQCKYRKIPWEGPKHAKKKANDQSNTNGAIQDPPFINRNENTLPIKAEYEDDVISLHCSISQATFDTVEKEIHNKFKLPLGTFRLKYLDIYGELMLVVSDQDLNDCITFSRNLDPPVARLLVLPSTRPI